MKNKNKNKKSITFTDKTKSKCLLLSLGTFLFASFVGLLNAPVIIGIIGGVSVVLFVVAYKKKTSEQIEAEKIAQTLTQRINGVINNES